MLRALALCAFVALTAGCGRVGYEIAQSASARPRGDGGHEAVVDGAAVDGGHRDGTGVRVIPPRPVADSGAGADGATLDGASRDAGPSLPAPVCQEGGPDCGECFLGSALGEAVAEGNAGGQGDDYSTACGGLGDIDVGFGWRAPFYGTFRVEAWSERPNVILGALGPSCRSFTGPCNSTNTQTAEVTVTMAAGEERVFVIEPGPTAWLGDYRLGIRHQCPGADLGSALGDGIGSAELRDVPGSQRPSGCAGGDGAEMTWDFTAPEDGTYVFDAAGSDVAPALYATEASCDGAEIACVEPPDGSLSLELVAGQRIVVVADLASGQSGDIFLNGRLQADVP